MTGASRGQVGIPRARIAQYTACMHFICIHVQPHFTVHSHLCAFYVYICIHTFQSTYKTCTYQCIYMHIICTCTLHIHTHIHTAHTTHASHIRSLHTHIDTYSDPFIHILTCMYTYAHTCSHSYAHTCTHLFGCI